MAESTTIARPYAEAAFSLARDQNALDAWSQMLRFASTIVQDPRVAQALDNPRLGAPEKESLLLSVAGDNLDQDGRSLVRVLVEADRIALLPEIAALFETLKDQAQGTAKAEIETAMELSDAQLAEIKSALERRFGKRIEATVRVNPALIGGARVTVGDTVLDGSVQAKLAAMANQLRA
ncbi:MAG TPA: F0F1 ATP synthase subunit delta [Casimicrobiaceae bacterium]|jgi:F-type H+-transporting ATPase subunit delta|nr:F0F1 ATP synthase subunit delta [Casimicrobiaceae bacterium]